MAYVLLITLLAVEIGSFIYEVVRKSTKKEWSLRRLIATGAEAVLFIILLLLPGIDTTFRFKGLIFLLIVRLIIGGIGALIVRRSSAAKRTGAKIASMLTGCLLIVSSLIPAFLFRDYQGRETTGPYEVSMCETILVDKDRIEAFENDGSYREVPAHFYYPSGTASGEKMPLVIFSHGAFGYYQSNTSTYMELASNGYVVVSLDHPYHSFFTKDTDGKTIIVDRGFINDVMTTGQNGTEREIYEVEKEWMELRTADVNFVLDSIIAGAGEGDTSACWFADSDAETEVKTVLQMIDTERIGLMGHSMGGATAVEVGKERDDIDAVVDIDGTMLGSIIGADDDGFIVEDVVYTVPLLEFENSEGHEDVLEARETGYAYPNIMIADNAECYYSTYFEGSLHMDYTDLPLFAPALARNLGSGDVDHGYMIDQVNHLVLEFFDCYLKGEGEFTVNESYQGVS